MANHYNRSYEETFRSAQMLSFTVLYDLFDMDKKQLKELNAHLVEHVNRDLDDSEKSTAISNKLLNEFGLDVTYVVKTFPHRAKIKMAGYTSKNSKKLRLTDWELVLDGFHHSMRDYLVLVLNELITNWSKTEEELKSYCDKMIEFSSVTYAEGMTNEFVVDYFIDQLDLSINLNK